MYRQFRIRDLIRPSVRDEYLESCQYFFIGRIVGEWHPVFGTPDQYSAVVSIREYIETGLRVLARPGRIR